MILDALTYSILAVTAVFTYVVIYLTMDKKNKRSEQNKNV